MNEFRPILVGDVTPRAGNGSRCRWSSLASLACVLLQDFANQFGIDLKRCLCEGSQNGWQIHQPILGRANEHSQRSNDIERSLLGGGARGRIIDQDEISRDFERKGDRFALARVQVQLFVDYCRRLHACPLGQSVCPLPNDFRRPASRSSVTTAMGTTTVPNSFGRMFDNVTMQQVIQRTCVGNNERHEDLSTLSSVIRSSSRSSVV